MEQKKFYEQPETEVVELKVQGQILAGSGGDTIGSDDNPAPRYEPEW